MATGPRLVALSKTLKQAQPLAMAKTSAWKA
jgi:hypothetical protein